MVGLMRLPIDARRSRTPGLFVDAVDERAADAFAARGFAGEEILQVTGRLDRRGIAAKQIMRPSRAPSLSATSACTGS